MSTPDYLEGFGPSNAIPQSSREDITFVSPRSPIRRRGLARCEVTVTGGKGFWMVHHSLTNTFAGSILRTRGVYSVRLKSGALVQGFASRRSAVDALLATL